MERGLPVISFEKYQAKNIARQNLFIVITRDYIDDENVCLEY